MTPTQQLHDLFSQLSTEFITKKVIPVLKRNQWRLHWVGGNVEVLDSNDDTVNNDPTFLALEDLAKTHFNGFYYTEHSVFWSLCIAYRGAVEIVDNGSASAIYYVNNI